jgi:hypothetical protein
MRARSESTPPRGPVTPPCFHSACSRAGLVAQQLGGDAPALRALQHQQHDRITVPATSCLLRAFDARGKLRPPNQSEPRAGRGAHA